MKNKNSLNNKKNKGVSEVIGYIITFSIVVLIVGMVYTAGIPMINDMKDTSAMESMEVSFLTLQSSIVRTAVGQSPISVIGLNIARGSIGVNRSSGNITITSSGIPPRIFNFSSIEWTLGHRKIIHELGAVIVSYDGIEGIILSEPPIFFTNWTNPHAFISVINATGDFSAAGGFTNLNFRHDNTSVHNSSSPLSPINISIHTKFPRAWSLFLNNSYNDAFNQFPTDAGYDSNSAFLNITRTNLNLTLVTHNLTISQ